MKIVENCRFAWKFHALALKYIYIDLSLLVYMYTDCQQTRGLTLWLSATRCSTHPFKCWSVQKTHKSAEKHKQTITSPQDLYFWFKVSDRVTKMAHVKILGSNCLRMTVFFLWSFFQKKPERKETHDKHHCRVLMMNCSLWIVHCWE